MNDFYHKKVISFENYVTVNLDYNDLDLILKALELLCYNIKNVYLLKEDTKSIYKVVKRISILYNLIHCNYTRHIDTEVEKKKGGEKIAI